MALQMLQTGEHALAVLTLESFFFFPRWSSLLDAGAGHGELDVRSKA